MKAYKGFNSDLTCRGFQYKEGETFTHDGDVALGAELGLLSMIKIGVQMIFDRVNRSKFDKNTSGDQSTAATSGYLSTAATSGYQSTAATSGDRSTAATSGHRSTAIAYGKDSIAVANGYQAKAKGVLGSYIAITEYDDNDNLLWFKCHKVDGKTVKPNTFYMLKNGRFVEVKG